MTRQLDDWIKAYVEYQKDTESPLSYITWTAISCVAGALQRRVYIPWGRGKIYPNLYIVLIGPSGLGKGQTMGPAIEIFKELGLPTAPNRVTIQDLMQRMATEITYYPGPGAPTTAGIPMSAMQVFAGEWVVLTGKRDVDKISVLTDLYDSPDEWENSTKWKGVDVLHNACLNKIAGSAPDWLSQILSEEAYGGGFTSRIIFVIETRLRQIQPIPPFTEWHMQRRKQLIHDLKKIADPRLFGAFSLDDESKEYYIKFDTESKTSMQDGIFPVNDPLFQGYCRRRPLFLLKMALIFAISRGAREYIRVEDLDKSLRILKNTEKNMPGLFSGTGRNDLEKVTQHIIDYLVLKGNCTRRHIFQRYQRDLTQESLSQVEHALEILGVVSSIKESADGRNAMYVVNPNWSKKG